MGYVSGSTVVEMSYIMPLILLMFVLIIHTVFYFYDRAVLNGAAAETAVLGAELERRHGAEEENLKEFFEERTSGKLILMTNPSVAITRTDNKIQVTAMVQKEDYQLQMLQNNRIRGLLELSVTGREEGSRYTYKTLNGASLEERYRMEAMEKKEILELTEQLLSLGEKVKEYLLDPNRILLMPQCIFKIRGEYNFCYLPIEYQSFCEAYHGLTEFFVKKIDYKDIETVFLTCMLHKETMKNIYDLKEILKKYREEAGEISLPEKRAEQKLDIFVNEEGEEELFPLEHPQKQEMVCEKKKYGFLKKFGKKIKSGYWGDWDDLLTEAENKTEM